MKKLIISIKKKRVLNIIYTASLLSISFLALLHISSLREYNLFLDISEQQKNSLSKESKNLIETSKKSLPFYLTGYFSNKNKERHFRALLEKYSREGLNFNVRYYDPDQNLIEAKSEGIEHENIVIVKHNNNKRKLRFFDEYTLSNTLITLLNKSTKNKVIAFLSGNGEKSIYSNKSDGIKEFKEILEDNEYKIINIDLSKKVEINKVDLMIIPSPEFNIEFIHTKKIESLVDQGMNLLVLQDALLPTNTLNSLIKKYGVSYSNNLIFLAKDDLRAKIFEQNTTFIEIFNQQHPISHLFSRDESFKLNIPDSRGLKLEPKNSKEMITTEIASTHKNTLSVDNIHTLEDLKYIKRSQYTKKSEIIVAASSKLNKFTKKHSKIVTIGAGKIITNSEINKEANLRFMSNVINFILNEDKLIKLKVNSESLTKLNISKSESIWSLIFICFIYPFIFLLRGYLLWRKK